MNTEFIEFEECEHEESTDERFKNLKNVIVSLNEKIAELEAEVRKLKNQ